MTAAIYTAYHQPAPRISSDQIHPIHVGRAGAAAPLPGMIGDDTGTHISERNGAYCELTALYWAWQNPSEASHVGLMHYRRLLDFTGRCPTGPVEARLELFDIPQWLDEAEDWLTTQSDAWDIVLPRLHTMGRTVEANYKAGHAPDDFDLLREIITRDHPAYADSFEEVARSRTVRLGNMALMRRALFDRYCAWLFDILFKVEAVPADRRFYTAYQARYLGFLAERLLTVWVHHEQKVNPSLTLRETSILNLSEALVSPQIAKGDPVEENAVHLAMASDRAYLPHAAAMLRSLIDHADPARPLRLYFLHSGIAPRQLDMLREVLADHPDAQMLAINSGKALEKGYRSTSRAPSNATYNRFLLFSLLPGLDRLLYLDADTILRADVCALYDTDMGDAQIAAVPDWIMTRTLSGPVKTIDPEVPDLSVYHREVLGLSDEQIARYFNAGVLLFNFAAMGDLPALGRELMREALEGRYLFRDQDILNKTFKQSLFLLDPRWNVFNSGPASYGRVPVGNQRQAMAAKKDPWLIHYADRDYKPWKAGALPWSQYYWSALIRTPFYSEVLAGLVQPKIQLTRSKSPVVRWGRELAERVPILKGPLLRLYAWLKGNGR
ncbi:DUF4422 domain-containing protein [Tropicibacter naphthalenivorans]|uniref:General stress protein A n=1 Tax=Tropicibacter naphthalenivorans TaxID=441103 RepID=A0A0P1H2D3_9RHOB|nr:DUF4422 domain-containing protein [Tropicibacter naphthalenivorans]CUH82615.1 General stress protein A [Tropicibacter naphthalenivorans]SMD08869.1 Lipopolysaccharide biosynthesis protein, LPS:glycosyltransferase [Tropicibacter naphthalenivorans]